MPWTTSPGPSSSGRGAWLACAGRLGSLLGWAALLVPAAWQDVGPCPHARRGLPAETHAAPARRRLLQNPSYYDLESTDQEAVSAYLSAMVEGVLAQLQDAGCLEVRPLGDGAGRAAAPAPGRVCTGALRALRHSLLPLWLHPHPPHTHIEPPPLPLSAGGRGDGRRAVPDRGSHRIVLLHAPPDHGHLCAAPGARHGRAGGRWAGPWASVWTWRG